MRTSPITTSLESGPSRGRRAVRLPRRLRVLACAACVVGACAVLFASQSPGAAIRGDLAAAAVTVHGLPASTPADAVERALQSTLGGRLATIDARGFPAVVAVTLRALDRRACVAAEGSARRLEGAVVVELESYRQPADCGKSNDMTWRIMP
jgi:hypothetical protein